MQIDQLDKERNLVCVGELARPGKMGAFCNQVRFKKSDLAQNITIYVGVRIS